ncbi:MAG: PLP-dependent transferase [Methylovirgula sp.]
MSDVAEGPGFATLAIHAGVATLDPSSDIFAPVDQGTALLGFDGYGDGASQTVASANASLEERMATLEGGTAALAVASGRAAQFLALHILLQQGDELIAGGRPYGGALHQIGEAYQSFGWQVKWADPAKAASFEKALSPQTRAILIESIPATGGIADIGAIAAIARNARVPLIVDNTLATPFLIRPFDYGADIIVHSAAKFLGSHESLTGGIIVDGGRFSWIGDARYPKLSLPRPEYGGRIFAETFGNFAFASACRMLGLHELGPALSPLNAFLIASGLETLALRMERHSQNALRVAEHLSGHKGVASVAYPGLASDPAHGLAKLYCPKGAGAMLSFRLAGGYHAARAFMQNLTLFSPLEDIGDTRSRAAHPASSTHRYLSDVAKDRSGAAPDLIRLSIGLEDLSDIIADLDQALTAAA